MKRFVFKLQAVLTLRQRAEQIALQRYARAIRQREAAAEQLTAVAAELSDARRHWLNAMADGCPAAQAAHAFSFCQSLENVRREREQGLHLADLELNKASQEMLHARQRREALERYLARQREEFDRKLRDEERKLVEGLVGRRPPVSFSGRSPRETPWN
jgi:flagellar export protein FliJ